MHAKTMYKTDIETKETSPVGTPGARGVQIQLLLDEKNGAPNFTMRRFIIQPGGQTPHHAHDWEHEVFILEGHGEVKLTDRSEPVSANAAILVPPGIEHSFHNTGSAPLAFLCLVPNGPATRG